MKKIIAILFFFALIAGNSIAQNVFSFKTEKGKKAKVSIPGKLITTFNEVSGGRAEYYVDFDSKNQQVTISMVAFTNKGYLGSDVTYCKYEAFDKMYLKNTPLQKQSAAGQLTIEQFYSYTLTAKDKFKLISCNSLTGIESEGEDDDAVIRFADEETAKAFMKELKQQVGI